jgi:transcriptional regulator with XRE-family HTH domain
MSNLGNKTVMSKNLQYYLNRSGKSQKELAEIVGVSTSAINDWILGKKYPRIDKIEIMADYFGILKSDLIEEKEKSVDNGLSENMKKLIDFVETVPEDKAELVLRVLKSLLED